MIFIVFWNKTQPNLNIQFQGTHILIKKYFQCKDSIFRVGASIFHVCGIIFKVCRATVAHFPLTFICKVLPRAFVWKFHPWLNSVLWHYFSQLSPYNKQSSKWRLVNKVVIYTDSNKWTTTTHRPSSLPQIL